MLDKKIKNNSSNVKIDKRLKDPKKNPYGKDVLYTTEGQWKYPGQVTRIPSNQITMQDVPYPVYGEDNTGYGQMMYPGQDYSYPGEYVTEYPMAMYGGDPSLPNITGHYQDGGAFKNFVKSLPENLKNTNPKDYDLYGLWESVGKPESFNDVKDTEYFPLQEDGTYHGFSANSNTGDWLKSKKHKSAWQEYLAYSLNPELNNMFNVRVNPEGYFGEDQLQYVPKKAYGGDPSLPNITGHYKFGGKYSKTETHMKTGGWLDKYQSGGLLKSSPANVIRDFEGGSYFDPVSGTIYLNSIRGDFDLPHELYHKQQLDEGRLRIAEADPYGIARTRPSMLEEQGQIDYPYYNRRAVDQDILTQNFFTGASSGVRNPSFNMIPYDMVYERAINPAMYYEPWTAEGEAELSETPEGEQELIKRGIGPNYNLDDYYRRGGFLPRAQDGWKKGPVSQEDSVRNMAYNTMTWEQNRGDRFGKGFSNFGNEGLKIKLNRNPTKKEAVDWYMENIYPQLDAYPTAMEKASAGDFLYNTGKKLLNYTDWDNRKNDNAAYDSWQNTVNTLSPNERRIALNNARDRYYQNIERQPGGKNENLNAYYNTWYGRQHATDQYVPLTSKDVTDKSNKKFYPVRKDYGGPLLMAQKGKIAKGTPNLKNSEQLPVVQKPKVAPVNNFRMDYGDLRRPIKETPVSTNVVRGIGAPPTFIDPRVTAEKRRKQLAEDNALIANYIRPKKMAAEKTRTVEDVDSRGQLISRPEVYQDSVEVPSIVGYNQLYNSPELLEEDYSEEEMKNMKMMKTDAELTKRQGKLDKAADIFMHPFQAAKYLAGSDQGRGIPDYFVNDENGSNPLDMVTSTFSPTHKIPFIYNSIKDGYNTLTNPEVYKNIGNVAQRYIKPGTVSDEDYNNSLVNLIDPAVNLFFLKSGIKDAKKLVKGVPSWEQRYLDKLQREEHLAKRIEARGKHQQLLEANKNLKGKKVTGSGKMEGLGTKGDAVISPSKRYGPIATPVFEGVYPQQSPTGNIKGDLFDLRNTGYTDVQGFNKQVQDLKRRAEFGVRPLEAQVPSNDMMKYASKRIATNIPGQVKGYDYQFPLEGLAPGNQFGFQPLTGKKAFSMITPNKRGGQVGIKKRKGTSQNVQSSMNEIMMRNELIFGPAGKRRFIPYKQVGGQSDKTGGWLDNYV